MRKNSTSGEALMGKESKRVTRNQILVKKLISTFIVCALFGAALTACAVIYIRGEIFSASSALSKSLERGIDTGMGRAFVQKIITDTSVHEDILDTFTAVYDENGEYYMYPQDTAVLNFKKDDETAAHFYELNGSAQNSLDEVISKYESERDEEGFSKYSYSLGSFCLTDDTFIPLEINAYSNDTRSEACRIDTINTNMSVPEGAQVYTADMVTRAYLTFSYAAVDREEFDFMRQLVKEKPHSAIITEFDRVTNISQINIDGKEYLIGETIIMNTGAAAGKALLFIAPVTLLVFVIAALLRTSREYAVLSAHYAIEDRRREITDRLAHDLKSPLMVISGYAENLEANTHPENNRHYAEAILENVKYMDSIIADVLELSKLERGSVKKNRESFDAADIIRELAAGYEERLNKNELTFSCEGSAPFISDKSLMKPILDNLISNAVKYTDRCGKISVKCEKGRVCISNTCADAGKIDTARLCEPFFKGDNSRSGRNGSGLGLSIAAAAAEGLGLKLTLSAEGGLFKAELCVL